MSGSGLIYAAIALLWAAVLIPMWLKSHDSTTGERSAERFGQAMRVLSRRAGSDEVPDAADEAALEPRRASPHRSRRPGPAVAEPRPRRQVSAPRRSARASIAHRRARTLFVLIGVAVLVVMLAVVGLLPMWAPLPVVVLLGAFVVHLRTQAMRSQTTRRPQRQSRRTVAPRAEPAAAEASREAAREPAWSSRWRTGFAAGPSRAVVVETKAMGASANSDADTERQPEGAFADDEAWRPNPLPLPTYVTAPKAMRPIRVIDLTTPGAWTSGRVLDDEATADEDLLAAEVASDELDALLEHEAAPAPADGDSSRRAVGD